MDICFIGGVFSKDEENMVFKKSKGTVQSAANVLQWNIIKGLDSCNEKPISIINSIFIGSYPKHYKDLFIKSSVWSHTEEANDIKIGFINLFAIKQISRGLAISKYIKKRVQKKQKNKKVIIIYSMHTPFVYAAAKAKQKNPDVHICLICPDLPEFMNLGKSRGHIFNVIKLIDRKILNYFLKYVDSFVFLTKYMVERVDVRSRNWIVMEGVVNLEELIIKRSMIARKDNNKIVLYTGTLNKAYGIIELLKAFKMIEDSTINLWICGAGEAEREVKELANSDIRVKYFGQVNRKYATQLQREADILINPRSDNDEYTKFSFPSKIMEYMISGTPTLIYKLAGIPEEYYDYLYTIEGEKPEDIAKSITKICNKSSEELMLFGKKAQEYVANNKNQNIQAKRIIDLINQGS